MWSLLYFFTVNPLGYTVSLNNFTSVYPFVQQFVLCETIWVRDYWQYLTNQMLPVHSMWHSICEKRLVYQFTNPYDDIPILPSRWNWRAQACWLPQVWGPRCFLGNRVMLREMVITSYHSHKVRIMAKPHLFVQFLLLKYDLKTNPNHTANLKWSPKSFCFHSFLWYTQFDVVPLVASDNPVREKNMGDERMNSEDQRVKWNLRTRGSKRGVLNSQEFISTPVYLKIISLTNMLFASPILSFQIWVRVPVWQFLFYSYN
jgi:hypothetical protein